MVHAKRIEARFRDFEKRRKDTSSLLNFIASITGCNFNRLALYSQFKKLVDKEDYSKEDMDEIFDFILLRNNLSVPLPQN
jgi:hypothetical protein